MGKNVVITQSNYIPWKGYFDSIAIADEFIVYDEMQYTKRDWRNRNLIKTPQGLKWLSIPVEVKGKFNQKISETKISEPGWNKSHWSTITQCYAKAKFFKSESAYFKHLYDTATSPFLTDVNLHFLKGICSYLNIPFNWRQSSEFDLCEDRNLRLVQLCKNVGGTNYYSGPAAKNYMDETCFEKENISVNYFDYSNYPEYEQLYPPFEHGVTILDLIFNEGPYAINFMKYAGKK